MHEPREVTLSERSSSLASAPTLDLETRQILARVGADLFGDEDTSTGRYTIRGKLGAGGMGVVYEAYDPLLDCAVALKQLHTHLVAEPGFIERLRAEARAMAKLRTEPHVVTLYDFFVQGSVVFVVMELVRGTNLRVWQGAPRSATELLAVYLQAGQGLAAAHRAGLVHRDFKPENVLIERDDVAKVGDFGLVRDTRARGSTEPSLGTDTTMEETRTTALTRAGRVVGTPQYMAPEQLRGEPTDPRSDQFSFCIALWEALFHEHPFFTAPQHNSGSEPADPDQPTRELSSRSVAPSANPLSLAYADAILHAPLRPVPRSTEAPEHVVRALTRGLGKEADTRFASMEALLAELRPRPSRRARAASVGLFAAMSGGLLWLSIPPAPAPPPTHDEIVTGQRAAFHEDLGLSDRTTLPRHVGDQLARYAERWAEEFALQAIALQRRPGAPETMTRLRCLGDARRSATNRALGVKNARPDDAHAVEIVDTLPAPEECRSMPLEWLACSQGLSALADAPEAAPALAAMAAAERMEAAGDFSRAATRAEEALQLADRLRHPILRGEAGYLLGRLYYLSGRAEEALAALSRAGEAAEPTSCLDLRARIYSRMIKVTALYPSLPAAPADAWTRIHRVLAAASPDGGARLADAYNERGLLQLLRLDDPTAAVSDLRRAIDLRERVTAGAPTSDLADSYLNLGIAYHRSGDLDSAERALKEADRLRALVHGPDHPLRYKESLALGELAIDRGDRAAAESSLTRAMASVSRGIGRDSPPAARILIARVRLRELEGDLAGAAEAARDAADTARRAGADPSERAELQAKAEALAARLGDTAAAGRLRDVALAAAADPRVALETRSAVSQALAEVRFNAEAFEEARAETDRALGLLIRAGLASGPRYVQLLRLRGLAGYFLAERHPEALDAAILDLSDALGADEGSMSAPERADVELTLAAAYLARERDGDTARGCAKLRELMTSPRRLPTERIGPELMELCSIE